MAVTSIWRVNGSLSGVVDYVRNAEKTDNPKFRSLSDVILYAVNSNKTGQTDDEFCEILHSFVTGINCSPSTVKDEMLAVKKRFGKETETVAYHGYQSFAPGEATPELAHEIGIKLAERLWGERYQVLVATHLDKEHHLHSHFIVNTVSFKDGKKYHRTTEDYRKMQMASDDLCREYGLSVIEEPRGRGKHYAEWQAEQEGKPTLRSMIRADIDRAVLASTTDRNFMKVMREMGYEFKTHTKYGEPLKYPAVRPPDGKSFFRLYNLGKGYSLEEISNRILENQYKHYPFSDIRSTKKYFYTGSPKNHRRISGLRALYFRYCYELKMIVKHPFSKKRVSFLLREDIVKMEKLNEEICFLGKHRIETMEDLNRWKENTTSEMDKLVRERKELRKAGSVDRIAEINKELTQLRKAIRICDRITERSITMRENMQRVKEEKELNEYESLGRCGRTGGKDDIGRN
ncbi:MAG: relaxase/mobilization nuclease domain-containing protein [Clostridia bacterium]